MAVWQNKQGLCDTSCLFQLLSLQHSFNYRSVKIGPPPPQSSVSACTHSPHYKSSSPSNLPSGDTHVSDLCVSCKANRVSGCISLHPRLITACDFVCAHQYPYPKQPSHLRDGWKWEGATHCLSNLTSPKCPKDPAL